MDISVVYEQARVPVTVLHITGEIRLGEELERTVKDLFGRGTRNILIDLSAVPYIASDGLRALHAIYRLLRTAAPAASDEAVKQGRAGATYYSPYLKLLNPSKRVVEMFRLTGYDRFLEIHTDVQRALDSFQP